MQRRDFIKQVTAIAALGGIVPKVMADNERSYNSGTIAVRLVEQSSGVTSVFLTEHGDADQAIIEAFYYTTVRLSHDAGETRVMLHKEATTPIGKGMTVATELMMPIASIEFIRVKEMKMLKQSEFGRK